MNETLFKTDWFEKYLIDGQSKLIEHIKILIYKKNPILFELLDYDNDRIFTEPLLFAYFFAKEKDATLEQLLLGYIEKDKWPDSIPAVIDNAGWIYLSEIGWLKTARRSCTVELRKDSNSLIGLDAFTDNQKIQYDFEPLHKIDYSFEVVRHHHPLLRPHFFDSKNRIVEVDITQVNQLQKDNLEKAFALIREFVPDFYQLLKKSIQKIVVFNEPEVKRNSFATLSVHGCSFFNSFQPEYDEVFFVEDIAHQCGHVIFNNIIHNNKDVFAISPETIVRDKGVFGMIVNFLEQRTLFVAFHALFTYYTISICLEECLLKGSLTKHQKHEALGRLAFCFYKYNRDIDLLGKTDKNGKSIYFTEVGLSLFKPMEDLCKRIKLNRGGDFKKMNLVNQPYNFSYKNFQKANPI